MNLNSLVPSARKRLQPLAISFFLLLFSGCIAIATKANTITVSTAASSGAGWSYSSGVITATANVTINNAAISAYLVSGNLRIEAGTDIVIDGDITPALGAGITRTLTLKAARDIRVEVSRSVNPATGLLNIVVWADSDAATGGMVYSKSGAVLNTQGGHLWIGGGSGSTAWNGLTVGDGYAIGGTTIPNTELQSGAGAAGFKNGITLYNCSLLSNGGNIALYGRSASTTTVYGYIGLFMGYSSTISSGTGSINIHAESTGSASSTTTGWFYGILMIPSNNTATVYGTASIESTSGSITIAASGQHNQNINHCSGLAMFTQGAAATAKIQSVAGDIAITGSNLNASNPSYGGIYLTGAGNEWVVSRTGNISLTGISSNAAIAGIRADASSRIGYDGTNAYAGNVSLKSNLLNFTQTTALVQSTGNLTVSPYTNTTAISIAGATGLSLTASYFNNNFVNGFNSIRVGSSAQSGAISLGAVTFSDDMILETTGAVTQTGAITATAQSLGLQGTAGTYTLTNAGNQVQRLTANTGTVSFTNSAALQLGTITASGTVNINTSAGDLTITDAIASANTGTTAIRLYADGARSAGDATGGNIIVSGSPAITTGAGGRALLYSGSVPGSTGLLGLVGVANARRNVDAATATFTPALASGVYALFRDASSTLPVGWIDFHSSCTGNDVQLHWSTAAEWMNSRFVVERSVDQLAWKVIGEVAGAGNANSIQQYQFADRSPVANAVVYYRLRQEDLDGRESYSRVIAVRCEAATSVALRLFPNPANRFVSITGIASLGMYTVISAMGIVVLQGQLRAGQAVINISALPAGVYVMRLKSGQQEQVIRLIKQH